MHQKTIMLLRHVIPCGPWERGRAGLAGMPGSCTRLQGFAGVRRACAHVLAYVVCAVAVSFCSLLLKHSDFLHSPYAEHNYLPYPTGSSLSPRLTPEPGASLTIFVNTPPALGSGCTDGNRARSLLRIGLSPSATYIHTKIKLEAPTRTRITS
jgi:hypothetical protein